ncbi:hypothetical protein SmJEL517_g05676 [Synchytrium microbalum]|uniref:Fatty acid hydroxylase domain-containing protein n=1 Tax=Synchytrium microbalum TaxID=1806994 RepID=A0A507BUI0_9FUNG|nr:uncharacterized protein SmJEL517_g05676 [Synchytrium microbalum]TPX30871.1 hypothetical protein SmJEL517_g05676 [Synchytrium microbalum]
MEFVVNALDDWILDTFYAALPQPIAPFVASRDAPARQVFTLWLVGMLGGVFLYFPFAGMSYLWIFDHNLKKHPKYLPNQISKEIIMTLQNLPIISILTAPWWFAELRGYSKLYDRIDDYGWGYLAFSAFFFMAFTDMLIYMIHRAEHHPSVYWWLHKPHHMWKVPTPFASHAFHPLDGYVQSLPYHIFIFLFPLHSMLYLGLFVFVNFWTISIHDGAHLYGGGILNGAAHHTIHHLEFNFNFGQYFTLWDRLGGSYRYPVEEYKSNMVWHRQQRAIELERMSKKNQKNAINDDVNVKSNGHSNKHANGNGHVNGTSTPLRRSRRHE